MGVVLKVWASPFAVKSGQAVSLVETHIGAPKEMQCGRCEFMRAPGLGANGLHVEFLSIDWLSEDVSFRN